MHNPFVGPSEMTLSVTKGGNLCYVITYNINKANQMTESFVHSWLSTLLMFDVM